jgi:hypothetical protein
MDELLASLVGGDRANRLLSTVLLPSQLAGEEQPRGRVARDTIAMALGLVLLDDLLARVPTGDRYGASCRAAGERIVYDHGAVRTVDWPDNGALPPGVESIRRLLVPLGYEEVGLYPLDGIHMTGKVFTHKDRPEDLPQYFVSELHVDRLPAEAQAAVTRVVGASKDPLGSADLGLLDALADHRWLPVDDAVRLVAAGAACFARHHDDPRLDDYETLLAHSSEMAWIATEGNAFNHATDRVPDVEQLAKDMHADWPMKDVVEWSRSGRVRQTALRADPVLRSFRGPDETRVERIVPGSFFEFISRDPLPDGSGLDLAFDASNAQGIFGMTRAS